MRKVGKVPVGIPSKKSHASSTRLMTRAASFQLNMTESKFPSYEIRLTERDRLDEIVSSPDYVHLEKMDANFWWLGIQTKGGDFIHVYLTSKRAIRANFVEEKATRRKARTGAGAARAAAAAKSRGDGGR